MPFKNYKQTNNAIGTLATGIAANTTTIILDGQGDLFPSSFPFLAKLEKHDSQSRVIKREIIEVTNRSGQTLTVTRSAGYCPADYTATTQTNTAFSFDFGDSFVLAPTSEQETDQNTEIARLETDKLDKTTFNAEKDVFGASSQGSDSYKITSTTVTSYTNGQVFKIQADVANSGAATLQLNSLAAKNIRKLGTGAFVDLETGDIIANQIFFATYNAGLDIFQFSVDPATAVVPTISATQKVFTAGENLTAGDPVYISTSDGKAYKTDATNSAKIAFVGFANDTVTTGASVKVNTAGTDGNQIGLSIGSEYYLGTYTQNGANITQANTNSSISQASTTARFGQEFTMLSAGRYYKLNQFKINVNTTGNPAGVFTAKIYASNRSTLLYTADATLPGNSTGELTFNFTNAKLDNSTLYFFELSLPTWSSGNFVSIPLADNNPYAGGQMYRYESGAWGLLSGMDAKFTAVLDYVTFTGSGITATLPVDINFSVVSVGFSISTTLLQINTPKNIVSSPLVTPSVGASPYTYQNTTGKNAVISITGGTVSAVAISRDNSNYYQTAAATNTSVVLGVFDYVKITYTGAPTVKVFTI